jgi:hypothetical protein
MTQRESTAQATRPPKAAPAEIVREYGPFAGAETIAGVSHDGRHVWAATGPRLIAFDPASGDLTRTLDCAGDAGTAFDGTHLYQIAEARIDKIDPASGAVVATRAWRGPRAACGSGSTATAGSTRSTPRRATSAAPSNRTASSPA